MLVARVVRHREFDDHLHAALAGLAQELHEVAQRAVARADAVIVGDIVAIIAVRRGVEGQQPETGDTEAREMVQAHGEAAEVADAVPVAVHVRLDVDAVDDRVLVPEVADAAREHDSPPLAFAVGSAKHARTSGDCKIQRSAAGESPQRPFMDGRQAAGDGRAAEGSVGGGVRAQGPLCMRCDCPAGIRPFVGRK